MADELSGQEFHEWRQAAYERAENKDVVEVVDELVSLIENDPGRTMQGAKALGMAFQLQERFHAHESVE